MLVFACAILGRIDTVRDHILQAEEWGASRANMCQVLGSGIVYGLARSRARLGEIERADDHLTNSLSMFPGIDGAKTLLETARRTDILTLSPDSVSSLRKLKNKILAKSPATTPSPLPLAPATIVDESEIGPALADFPVNNSDGYGGFSVVESEGRQFCAYYNRNRDLIIAYRHLETTEAWKEHCLGERVEWDSHNYVVMAIDGEGILHLAGNMHASPLRYYRSTTPLDPATMRRVDVMTGKNEDEVTYPKFFLQPDGTLIFSFRHGRSGNGDIYFNAWSPSLQQWQRTTDKPLLSGEGIANPYMHGPVLGPDGLFHACWVWRWTPEADTNHSLCYARSADLQVWTDSLGTPLSLPITQQTSEIIAGVSVGQGLINNNHLIGFDAVKRPMITCHRNDEKGNTQLFISRLEGDRWICRQITDWPYRWVFTGRGSLHFEITFLPALSIGDGLIVQEYEHSKLGVGSIILDEETLKPIGTAPVSMLRPQDSRSPSDSRIPLRRNIAFEWGRLLGDDRFPALVWDSLPENRDHPQDRRHAPDGRLRLVTIQRGGVDISDLSRSAEQPIPNGEELAQTQLLEAVFGRVENVEAESLARGYVISSLREAIRRKPN